MLGTRLKPALRQWNRTTGPYLIGLTGGSASGKSSVAKRMSDLNWGVVDCDKLGHAAYTPGTEAFNAIVEEWGQAVVADDGSINRFQQITKSDIDKSLDLEKFSKRNDSDFSLSLARS